MWRPVLVLADHVLYDCHAYMMLNQCHSSQCTLSFTSVRDSAVFIGRSSSPMGVVVAAAALKTGLNDRMTGMRPQTNFCAELV